MNSNLKKPNETECSSQEEPSPKRLLFVQLNRLGDLIQTATIAKELKLQRPDIQIDLVARKIFSEKTNELLEVFFDNIYHVGMNTFLTETCSLEQSSKELFETIDKISSKPITILINQSFSKSSAILSSLISSQFKFGMHVNKLGEINIRDKWSQYVHSSIMTGNHNDMHINDIFRLMIGTHSSSRTKAVTNFSSNTIALNPFSSHQKKSWRIEKWSEIIYQILKKDSNAEISLLGTSQDEEVLFQLKKTPLLKSYQNRINVHSRQSIADTFSLIQSSRLYLGHDSLCSNLAALAERKSIIISLGTVRPQETFPDGIGNYILSPRTGCFPCFPNDSCTNFKCHADINYNLVVEVTLQAFATGNLNVETLHKNLNQFQLSAANIFESVQLSSNLLSLKNITDAKMNIESFTRGIFRVSWLYYLEEISESFGSADTVFPEQSILESFQNNVRQLFDVCQHGMSFSKYILEEISKKSPCLTTIRDYGTKIDEIDQLITKIQAISPGLTPICASVLSKKAQLEPGHLVHLTEQTFLIYNEGVTLCKVLTELIGNALIKTQNTKRNTTKMVSV